MPKLAKDEIKNLTAEDMRDYMYGAIQSMIEGNTPKNVCFQYYMPAIPFGPELASFMDIGPKAKEWKEKGFTIADMMRAAVNFATIVDYVPVLSNEKAEGDIVDINTLISSGMKISNLYESILTNCRVFDSQRSNEDKEKLRKLRALLYVESPEPSTSTDVTDTDSLSDDDLLSGFDDESDIDLSEIFNDGASLSDLVSDPNALLPMTKTMKLYDALRSNYEQTVLSVIDQLKLISPNDPNASLRLKILKRKRTSARQRWEAQGHKTKVEGIIARIEQLSQGGVPEYLAELRERFDGSNIEAPLFSDEELGVSLLSESAYYTALRPNGILSAPSQMRVSLSNSDSSNYSKFKNSKTSGSFKAPVIGIFGGAGGKITKLDQNRESEVFKNEFEISFEIVQGLIDRPWFARDFVESRAYSTVDPRTNTPIDAVNQITQLSDGKVPPEKGMMKSLPMTVYFIRNLKVKSRAFANLSESDIEKISGSGGTSIFGFGAKASHENETITTSYSTANSFGEITANGSYLVAMSSVYLKKAPDPDFNTFPKDQWI